MRFYFLFIFLFSLKNQLINCYQLFNLRNCNKTIVFYNLDFYGSLVINGSFKNLKQSETFCQFSIMAKNLKSFDLILFNLQLFEMIPLGPLKSIAVLLFSSRNRGLVHFKLLDASIIFKNVFLTELLKERDFVWNSHLLVELKIYGVSSTNLILVLTPGYFCSNIAENEMFRCEDNYKENNICIATRFKCDGWNNCPYRENDESHLTCNSQFIHHILIPSLVLSSMVFILGWILLKLTPCILEQRRLFLVRRNHLILSALTSPSVNSRNGQTIVQNFSFNRRISESNSTPDNIPYSPPKYQNIYRPNNSVDHHLPPSYSEDANIGVIPDFFKRFFGKIRKQSRVDNAEIVLTNSEVPKSIFDSQSDINNEISSAVKQDNCVSSINSDTLTSITSTDVFWSPPNFINTYVANNKR